MPFHVVCVEDDFAPIGNRHGPYVYGTGAEAELVARNYTADNPGKRYQPRKVKAERKGAKPEWMLREEARFEDGTYTRVPWLYEAWFNDPHKGTRHYWGNVHPEHYLHVSKTEPGKVAFTPDAEHGEANRKTRMRPGRYLKQFYGKGITEASIRHYAAEFAQKYEPLRLNLATTADDIEAVYLNGPRSCMSHPADDFSSPEHPVRVYAAGDLAIGYIGSLESVSGRAICWPKKLVYGRVYGDEYRLLKAFELAGYKHNPEGMEGARLLKKQHEGHFVVPYIDHFGRVREDGKYLRLDGDGPICGDSTNGLSGRLDVCASCDETIDGDSYTVGDEMWCDRCTEEHAFRCDYHGRYESGDPIVLEDGESWCDHAFENNGFTCSATGENHRSGDAVELANGDMVSEMWFRDNGFFCAECDEKHSTEEEARACCGTEAAPRRPRPGRDEHPGQGELHLDPVPITEVRVGDTVRLAESRDHGYGVPAGDYEVIAIARDSYDDRLIVRHGRYPRWHVRNRFYRGVVRHAPAPAPAPAPLWRDITAGDWVRVECDHPESTFGAESGVYRVVEVHPTPEITCHLAIYRSDVRSHWWISDRYVVSKVPSWNGIKTGDMVMVTDREHNSTAPAPFVVLHISDQHIDRHLLVQHPGGWPMRDGNRRGAPDDIPNGTHCWWMRDSDVIGPVTASGETVARLEPAA